MKFGMAFTEYLHGDQEEFLDKCSHVEYKRLKKVLKSCRACRALKATCDDETGEHHQDHALSDQAWQCESCPLCDQVFFSELRKDASDVAGCFSSRVRRLLQLHNAAGMQRYFGRFCQCFKNDRKAMVEECQMLIKYVAMNALAIKKILKKYDKVHGSVNGRKFKSKMHAEHIEILQSTWLIELGAFYLNFNEEKGENSDEIFSSFSCDLSTTEPVMTLELPGCVKLEYNLTCAICLDLVFHPYALSCGHLFCKSCSCSAASIMMFEGLKAATPESKCPVCREVGVYADSVHLIELDLLLKKRCREYWKERLTAERAEMVKQSKLYWDMQTKYMIGY